ncbi:MAG: hypothetical protein B6U75_03695 [Desulfurococcales archaeon ex4484_217_1]|nr:MAG: hypothetical protein B6U75_03695 [Desulfurococcales archaeon ex4484_217_1]
MKVLRLYFTVFDEKAFNEVKEYLEKSFGRRNVIVHKSIVVPEFRYLEILNFDKDPEAVKKSIEENFKLKVKVDVVEKIIPSHRR